MHGNLYLFAALDVKHYYSHHLSSIGAQPWHKCDLISSLLEKNANEFAAQQEWEQEWNQFGLASRLSKEVCACMHIICVLYVCSCIIVCVHAYACDI